VRSYVTHAAFSINLWFLGTPG